MEHASKELKEFLDDLMNYNGSVYLYFVTRHLKEGLRNQKVLEKYDFNVQKVDVSDELQNYFKEILINRFEKTLQKDEFGGTKI